MSTQAPTGYTISAANIDEGALPVRPGSIVNFHDIEPHDSGAEIGRSWYGRSEGMVVAYTEGDAGAKLKRDQQDDEHFVVIADEATTVTITTADASATVSGEAVVLVPPGDSELRFDTPGKLYRVFTACGAPDLAARSFNAELYSSPDHFLPPAEPWPMPRGGYGLRVYRRSEHYATEDAWTTIFHSRMLMVNWVRPIADWEVIAGPTRRLRLNTHYHRDIDQIIVVLEGEFVAHARVPWTIDPANWHDDRHVPLRAPAFFAAPPHLVHGVHAVGAGRNQVFDCFSPPRLDYVQLPESRNRDEYPTPEDGSAS